MALALVGAFVARCATVANPLLDLTLFRSRSFRWSNVALLGFAIGFNAMFLSNVLFLTQVWHYTVLRAGLAISVGPAIVAATAPWFGRLAGRVGQRRLLVPGGLVWVSGGVFLLARATASPHYVAQYRPATCLTGLGVALCPPQLSSAAVSGLPPDRFGSGSAVTQSVRNLGATLGVALTVAFTADVAAGRALPLFHRVWWLLAASGLFVSALSALLPGRQLQPAADEVTAAPSAVGSAS